MAKKTKTKARKSKKPSLDNSLIARTNRIIKTSLFARVYAAVSVCILFATTALWAILGAKVQYMNADQLVDTLLFRNSHTLSQATLPNAHSYLIKWPLFWLGRLIGTSANDYAIVTVAIVLLTVGSLTYILYRIQPRLLMFGTICLALASTLLLVPTLPYPGGLLPVNMAMITTRNVEYVVYIICLALLANTKSLKNLRFWMATGGLTLLLASDKLFMPLSLGGATLALLAYVFVKRWDRVTIVMNWLIASTIAAASATVVLWLINSSGLVHISGQTGAGPYGLVHNPTNIVLGLIFGVTGLFTNFGANPGVAETVVRHVPHQVIDGVLSSSGPSFIINGLILVFGIYACYKLVWSTLRQLPSKTKKVPAQSIALNLSLMMIWTTIAAFGVFVVSQHYYAVDARYLAIALFAVFVALATFTRSIRRPASHIVLAGCVIIASILLGLTNVHKNYQKDINTLSQIDNRNTRVARALEQHPVKTLVGDYWRVIPTSVVNNQPVTPLSNCSQLRDVLSSGAWQPNLDTNSFAYLLTLDGSLTDYPNCTLKDVIDAYGRPNASTLIAGSYTNPVEQILFYDHGRNQSAPATPQPAAGPSTVVPITPDELPNTTCGGPTVMNFVAHEDDDLLFMNPDILNDIKSGDCIRTVYLTAGDAGQDELYWLNRERGSKAAYAKMLGLVNPIWVQRIVKLADGRFITIANPRGNTKVSLIFMYLPDGGLKGEGFNGSDFGSLAKLRSGEAHKLNTVDGQSTYDSNGLVEALESLLRIYQPGRINTQALFVGKTFPDHSDHVAVGSFVQQAYSKYEQDQYENQVLIPIKYYMGYPIREHSQNISGKDLEAKQSIFFAYAQFDDGVCPTLQQCIKVPTYSSYLSRQYLSTN